jgi:chromate reductase, NAD(P)H dehydrogenase (quinone)
VAASDTRLLLVTGSTRAGSTNTAALRTAHATAADHLTTVLYERLADLPAFNPDDDYDPLPPVVSELREEVATADGVLFCTPEYAGALPGSFKNLLDWTVGGAEMYVGAVILEPASVFVPRDAVGPGGLIIPAAIRSEIEAALRAFAAQVRAA